MSVRDLQELVREARIDASGAGAAASSSQPRVAPPAKRPSGSRSPSTLAASAAHQTHPASSFEAARAALQTPAHGFRLDDLLSCIDGAYVSDWLRQANEAVQGLQTWWATGANALQFAHFWLSDFPEDKRRELMSMEAHLLTERLKLAFAAGLDTAVVSERDLAKLIRAVFHEYPATLCDGDGSDFLDVLRVVAAGRQEAYRALLSFIKCSTTNPQFAQWLLAIRSYALVSICASAVDFYKNLCDEADLCSMPRPGTSAGSRPLPVASGGGEGGAAGGARPTTANNQRPMTATGQRPRTAATGATGGQQPRQRQRLGQVSPEEQLLQEAAAAAQPVDPAVQDGFEAVRLGHADVLYYLLSRGVLAIDSVDHQGRTLLFVAALHECEEAVAFLLENADLFDVNAPAQSGNTALHAAAQTGNAAIVSMLLAAGANPAIPNPTTGATPAMLAAMHGHDQVAALLGV